MNNFKRWVIYTAAFFLLIAASLVNVPNLYYMAALLLVLPWVSYGLGMLSLRNLEFDREVLGSGWEGETTTFSVIVRSSSKLPRLFLQAKDDLPEWLSPAEEPPLFNAAADSETTIPYRVELGKRGAYTIETMHVTALDPLGIYSFTRSYPVRSEVIVYPVPQIIPDFVLSGAERFGFRDLPIAATKGSGVDPDGVREYVPGDPLRRMHWKSTARTGKLNVIEFEESHAVNVVLALDLYKGSNIGTGKETTLEYLVRAAASIAQMAIRQGASVRLVTGDTPDPADFAGRGSEHFLMILTALARAEATDTVPLAESLVRRVGHLLPGTTLILLTAHPDIELADAIAHYSVGGTQVITLYADPASFASGLHTKQGATGAFLEGLVAAKVLPYMLRKNEKSHIQPELITDVRHFTRH